MDMRLRVCSTHALRGRLLRRSEISMGDWLRWVEATSFLGVVCEGCLGLAGLF